MHVERKFSKNDAFCFRRSLFSFKFWIFEFRESISRSWKNSVARRIRVSLIRLVLVLLRIAYKKQWLFLLTTKCCNANFFRYSSENWYIMALSQQTNMNEFPKTFFSISLKFYIFVILFCGLFLKCQYKLSCACSDEKMFCSFWHCQDLSDALPKQKISCLVAKGEKQIGLNWFISRLKDVSIVQNDFLKCALMESKLLTS